MGMTQIPQILTLQCSVKLCSLQTLMMPPLMSMMKTFGNNLESLTSKMMTNRNMAEDEEAEDEEQKVNIRRGHKAMTTKMMTAKRINFRTMRVLKKWKERRCWELYHILFMQNGSKYLMT